MTVSATPTTPASPSTPTLVAQIEARQAEHDQSPKTAVPRPLSPRAIKNSPSADCNFRQRAHHYSALPVKTLFRVRMRDLDLTNSDIQPVMGYAKPNVIAMMRTGSMRLPVTKVAEVAKILEVD